MAPEDPQTVKVKFKSAQLYYLKNHFADAAVRFNEIIENYPTEKMARLSAELIVESFNVRKDWVNLNKYSRLFQENGNLMKDKEFAERIGDYVEFASVKEIFEIYEKQESELQIADRYIAYSKEFPKGKYAMLAAYNAFNKLDAVNELDRSMKQASVLLNDFLRTSSFQRRMLKQIRRISLAFLSRSLFVRRFSSDTLNTTLAWHSLMRPLDTSHRTRASLRKIKPFLKTKRFRSVFQMQL